jgi:Protein of unknown function (DUF4239)
MWRLAIALFEIEGEQNVRTASDGPGRRGAPGREYRALPAMMRPDAVYQYPIWAVGSSLAVAAVFATIILELGVRHFVPAEFRRQHNDIAAAIFSIIGVTYAVLLAFVAMLAWDGFNKARAASYQEAVQVGDVFDAAAGLAEPARAKLIEGLTSYTRAVIAIEWPTQAEGKLVRAGDRYLDEMNRLMAGVKPASQADTNYHALLLQSLERLHDARQDRLLAAETAIPGIVWFVVFVGGTITIAFSSFLGTPNIHMHLGMCSLLALSGILVLLLIIALSNPFRGDFRVSTAPYDFVMSRLANPATPATQ